MSIKRNFLLGSSALTAFVMAAPAWAAPVTIGGQQIETNDGTPNNGNPGGVIMICPLLSSPISILELATKEEWNGKEAQAGRDHRQAA